jgi:nucleoid DNA-binding protein
MADKKASSQKRLKEATNTTNVNMKVTKSSSKVAKAAKKLVRKEKQTRLEIMQTLAEASNLSRSDIERVFDNLFLLMESHLRKNGSGEFTIPKTGVKILRYKKPARKERRMVSPLIDKEVVIAAKPARFAVKFIALKPLKDAVE